MGLLLTIMVAGIVYKAAEMGNRNGFWWATISVGITLVSGMFIPLSFGVGLFGTLLIMFICNLISDPSVS